MKFKTIMVVLMTILTTQLSAQVMTRSDNYFGVNNQGYVITVDRGGDGYNQISTEGNYFDTYFDLKQPTPGNGVNGLGWRYGSDGKTINYKLRSFWMSYNSNNTANDGKVLAGAYGWLRNTNSRSSSTTVAEYYVVDKWAVRTNPQGQDLPYLVGSPTVNYGGAYWSEGSWYDVYRTVRNSKPSIIGSATFYQYWAIRRNQRSVSQSATYTIRMQDAFNKWRGNWGLPNWHDYQVMKFEGYNSQGGGAMNVTNASSESGGSNRNVASGGVSATIDEAPLVVSVAPNPGTVFESTVILQLENKGKIELSLLSAEGREVGAVVRTGFAGENRIRLADFISGKLAPGVYMLYVESGSESAVQRLMVH